MKVRKFLFSKEMLERVPDSQRVVLVYAGHISNELNWLSKLSLILQQTNKEIAIKLPGKLSPQETAILDGNATQMCIHGRLFAGKVHEAVRFVEQWCFRKPWFEDTCKRMDPEGREALSRIQSYLEQIKSGARPDLLRLVRDKFGFHYDKIAAKKSIGVPESLDNFTTYLADNVGNTLYLGSEYAVTGYLVESSEQGDAKKTLENLTDDILNLAGDINNLLGHTLASLCLKYFGDSDSGMGYKEEINLVTAPINDLRLPFFTTLPEKKIFPTP